VLVTLTTDRPAKSQPAACSLPGLDTFGGRKWFNPNRVWTAPPVRVLILLCLTVVRLTPSVRAIRWGLLLSVGQVAAG
jgi:hypothetical protein